MSVDTNIYIGCYLRVWMPKEKYISGMVCPHGCRGIVSSGDKFCDRCGRALVPFYSERFGDAYTLIEDIFGYDRFTQATDMIGDDNGYIIIISNERGDDNVKITNNPEVAEWDLPQKNFANNWPILEVELSKRDIRYEEKFGIVTWYS